MGAEVDSLDIKISASATRANNQIDKLINNISKLSASLGTLNTGNLTGLANGVQKLSTSMQGMSSVKGADFTRIATGITKMSMIDTASINRAASAMTQMGKSLSKITGTAESSKNISDLAKGISQLGYKSATNAIDNIPKLATAMKRLMNTLAGAPQVSQNLIDMTNALAKLARTGSASGSAAKSLTNSLNLFSSSTVKARKSSFSLAAAIGKVYASYWLLFRAVGKVKSAIDISSDLTEVQNVVVNTFGQYTDLVEKFSKSAIKAYGISELTAKETASRFQAMGIAMGAPIKKMSDMSISLTELSADLASFYNVEQADAARSLWSVFTGETEPMRKFGIDLTQNTLKEYAMKNGLDANISSMTQLQKTMLRYQYVMENTANVQGDFARTSQNWANQIRILKEQVKALGAVLGNAFINMLKPLVQALNKAMSAVITFANNVVNALGKIFGWKIEIQSGSIADDFETASDSADDLASGTGKAADNAKKLRQQLQGVDELNVLTTDKSGSGSGGKGSGSGASDGGADTNGLKYKLEETEGLFKSSINTLEELGEYIGTTLTNSLNKIQWNNVYEGARNFGKGLADFLNGLISPELFGAVGKTIAGSLNTAIYAALSFGENFDFNDFGESIASGINNFFQTFDFASLANTLNVWVDGIKTTVLTALKKISWSDILKGGMEFLTNLDLDTIAITVGAFKWFHGGKEIVAGALNTLMKNKIATGVGDVKVPLSASIELSITAAVIGFKIGNWLYDNVKGIQSISDGITEWIMKDGEEIAIAKTISVSLAGLSISLAAVGIAKAVGKAIGKAIGGKAIDVTTESAVDLMFDAQNLNATSFGEALKTSIGKIANLGSKIASGVGTALSKAGNVVWTGLSSLASSLVSALGTAISGLSTVASTIASAVGSALSAAGTFLTSSVSTVFTAGAASIATGLFAAIGAAIAGWKIGQLIYDKFSEQIDDIVFKVGDFFTKTIPNALSNAGKAVVDLAVNVKGNIDEKAQQIKDWFANKKDEVKDFVANVKADGADKLKNIKEHWNGIKKGTKRLAVSFKDSVSSKLKKVQKAWDSIVGKAKKLSVTFTDNFTAPIKRAWNRIADSINSMVDKIPVVGKKIASVPKFPGYEQGGYPQKYSLFMAGENGIPEIAGTVGGKTAVAGGAEITGIRDAIYSTSQQEMEYLREQNQLLQGILAKEFGISKNDIGKASRSYARDYYNRTGKEAYSF